MKTIIASGLALFTFVALLAFSPVTLASSLEMIQVEQIVDDLEGDYRLNIRLVPQIVNSERIWLRDLKTLANIMDNNVVVTPGSVKLNSLDCIHLVCRNN